MADTRTVERRDPDVPAQVERARSRPISAPRIDIFERGDGTVLVADMPGVDEKTVDIELDHGVLTIRGDVEPPTLEGRESIWTEYRAADYQRAFTLSGDVDADRIEASLEDGVLRVFLPKAGPTRKKIEVRGG